MNCGTCLKRKLKKEHDDESEMTMRTDNEGERTANFSIDVEWTTCDNDCMASDGEAMFVLNGIELSSVRTRRS